MRGRITLMEKAGKTATDLSSVVVYLDGVAAPVRPNKTTMVMRGKAFTPHLVVVPVGGTVEFPNQDTILHNVFSVTKSNPFDLELYKAPKSASWTFRQPGIVNVYCNIHPQMSAVVLVRDNPYYTMADSEGRFVIENVPAGRYVLRAWHDRGGENSQNITVGGPGALEASLTLDASNYKWVPHRNKLGKAYPRESYR